MPLRSTCVLSGRGDRVGDNDRNSATSYISVNKTGQGIFRNMTVFPGSSLPGPGANLQLYFADTMESQNPASKTYATGRI